MSKPATANTFELVFVPGARPRDRLRFSVSEADIEDAIDYGRAEPNAPLDRQLADAAYHMVLMKQVCDDDRIFDRPWVLLHNGAIASMNHLAMGTRATDLR